eukprot:17765-Chlamydomonas_euryale.AAC.1
MHQSTEIGNENKRGARAKTGARSAAPSFFGAAGGGSLRGRCAQSRRDGWLERDRGETWSVSLQRARRRGAAPQTHSCLRIARRGRETGRDFSGQERERSLSHTCT